MGFFPLLAARNVAAVNSCKQVFLVCACMCGHMVPILLSIFLAVGLPRSYGSSIFTLLRNFLHCFL